MTMIALLLVGLLFVGCTRTEAQVVATSPKDARGRFTYEVALPAQPIFLADGYREWDHVAPAPAGTVCEVRSFIAWDRGSLGEANLELTVGGYRLYERSEHKETNRDYDAWESEPISRTRPALIDFERGDAVHIHMGAAMTGPRTNDGGLSTRVQFAFRMRMSATGRCD